MKNLKALMMLLIGVFALTVTSCNTDDGDHYYTHEEQDAIQAKMVGTYSGSLYMYKPNTSTKKYEVYHSLPTTWTASKGNPALGKDSLITISNFPINMLDSAINVSKGEITTEATQLRELRTAISMLAPEDIRCAYYVPSTQFITSAGYQFIVNPLCVNSDFYTLKATGQSMFIKKTLSYGGTTHDVYFVFLLNYYGGAYSVTNRSFQFNMALASITIDKKPVDYYSNSFASTYFRPLIITCVKSN